ncbi:MAG: hypothetical protein K0R57_414 [Paenibacillaceae bacterium]|jgi:menaquinone-dependent protoporphyrinogen IX oxidase|nr:hypothetical protein [Paenibacillaceae bacterium]
MPTLILYATKSGASKECADLLGASLMDCTICDVTACPPDLARYDTIIVGSGVRMGKLYKPARNFILDHQELLLAKSIAFYLCNAYENTTPKAIEKSIPRELREHAACIEALGGKPPFASVKNQDWIRTDRVRALVQAIAK